MISLKLLKILKAPLLSPLTIIINQMLNTGIFPNNLKVAKIIPIYKKDDQFIFDNYRPISLLPVMSKLFEKVIFKQLYTFFQDNKLFYESQYGFRTGHSTELAALEIVDQIISEMDNGEVPINIFLDLSKAFDTLDHEILLHKLNYYGVKGIPYNLIKNYLTDRKQFVDIDGIKSDCLSISTGVPQGSVLGPLLFIIYINDLSLVSTIFKPIIYADDTTLFSTLKSFYSNTDTNIDLHINKELDKVDTWLKANKLSLNVKKTKLMIFHMPSKKIKLPKIEIMKVQIECVDQFNFLGITLDKHLTFKSHIDNVSKKISRSIGILSRLKYLLPERIKLIIYNSLILSHINYGILIWGHHADRIFKLQKKAIRIITKSKYNAHTEPLFKNLNLLKISDIFKLYQLKFFHKYINKQLPSYFQELPFRSQNETHHYYTRDHQRLQIYLRKHKFAEQCVRQSIPKLLNDMPLCIKQKLYTHSLNGFSIYVKNFYISKYSNECVLINCHVCNEN